MYKKTGMKKTEKRAGKMKRRRPGQMKELLIIAGVVAVAFFTPQILFFIRDRILYNRLELSLREILHKLRL